MEKELWKKCQLLVDTGCGDMVLHLYIKELQNKLTTEQFEKLGDVSVHLTRVMATKANMKHVIQVFLDLSKKGVISIPGK